jgi:hypothetical protein
MQGRIEIAITEAASGKHHLHNSIGQIHGICPIFLSKIVAPLRHDLKLLSGRFIPTLPADVAAVVPSFYIAALLPPRMLESWHLLPKLLLCTAEIA